MNRKHGEAAQRFAERRRREDEAPRLVDIIPRLESLRLEVRQTRAGVKLAEASHIRTVIVQRAPALFEIPCLDSSCKDGGHDITQDILRALRAGEERFEGEDACEGALGSANCRRVLNYVATATYRK